MIHVVAYGGSKKKRWFEFFRKKICSIVAESADPLQNLQKNAARVGSGRARGRTVSNPDPPKNLQKFCETLLINLTALKTKNFQKLKLSMKYNQISKRKHRQPRTTRKPSKRGVSNNTGIVFSTHEHSESIGFCALLTPPGLSTIEF